MQCHRKHRKQKQDGIVLIETLIAILLFSIGVLALVGLQAVMAKDVTHAKLRSEAAFLANQLIGQMWVDQANLASYAMTSGACNTSGYAPCANWRSQVGQVLPSGQAAVAISGTAVDITLSWQLPGESGSRFQMSAVVSN